MSQYRKKPVVIEAVLYDGTNTAARWVNEHGGNTYHDECGLFLIRTLEGDMRADQGDWIIKGVMGEFYPCKPDIFAATYELVVGGRRMKASEIVKFINATIEKHGDMKVVAQTETDLRDSRVTGFWTKVVPATGEMVLVVCHNDAREARRDG